MTDVIPGHHAHTLRDRCIRRNRDRRTGHEVADLRGLRGPALQNWAFIGLPCPKSMVGIRPVIVDRAPHLRPLTLNSGCLRSPVLPGPGKADNAEIRGVLLLYADEMITKVPVCQKKAQPFSLIAFAIFFQNFLHIHSNLLSVA